MFKANARVRMDRPLGTVAGLVTVFLLVIGAGYLLLSDHDANAQQALTEADLAKIPGGDQPIKFSHSIHATQNQIDCQYCHIYARRSASAGVPPVAICMGCHTSVATNLSEIQKVTKYWDDQEPIPWVKIHDVPDFVKFPHDRHVNAKNEVYPAGVPCADCHGDIAGMSVVEVANPDFGTMGWCLTCHLTVPGALERKRRTPTEPGSMEVMYKIHPSGDYARPETTDCLTCHY